MSALGNIIKPNGVFLEKAINPIQRNFFFEHHRPGGYYPYYVKNSAAATIYNFDALGNLFTLTRGYDSANAYLGYEQRQFFFLVSSEALDIIDEMNQDLIDANASFSGGFPEDSRFNVEGFNYAYRFISGIVEIDNNLVSTNHFGNFIKYKLGTTDEDGNYIENKAYFQPTYEVNYDNLILETNDEENTLTVKYTAPIKLGNHFNYEQFKADGNTVLYLMIPYIQNDGLRIYQRLNPETGDYNPQLGYVAFKITDKDGDGDIKFDHIDDMDYIDSFEATISYPKYF